MRFPSVKPEAFSFSTRGLPARDRGDALRGLRQRGVMTVEPLRDHLPQAAIRKRFLAGADILSGALGGLRQFGTQHSGDNLFLALNVEGESAARQQDRDLTIRPGDAVFFSGADKLCTINRPTPVRFAAMRIPYCALAPLVANLDEGVMRLIPKETSALRLLARYLRAIDMGYDLDSAELSVTVASHIRDLVALCLGAGRDYQKVAEEGGVREARLRTIKADIAANLCDGALNVNAVAGRHSVTPRYIQKLFAGEGTTFSEFVLGQRLITAYHRLRDPRFALRSISAIAYDVGFMDLSYFNRAFRRRHEATPSEVRAQGRGLATSDAMAGPTI
jgi:AraC-like DNA-binding protein